VQCKDQSRCKRMHACPTGYALGGASFGGGDFIGHPTDTLRCDLVDPPGSVPLWFFSSRDTPEELWVSGEESRFGMSGCPDGYYLSAIHVERVYVRCSFAGTQLTGIYYVPKNPDPHNKHKFAECVNNKHVPHSESQIGVMIGYSADKGQIVCGTLQIVMVNPDDANPGYPPKIPGFHPR
jgi:hypothetical protein